MTTPTLPIHDMEQRHYGLTKAIADLYTEAAAVCLDRHHQPPTDFNLDSRGVRSAAVVEWPRPDARTRDAWANQIDATEMGAYACALAVVELTDGLVAVHRAETKTGADYYIAPKGTPAEDLQQWLRLEVSGVDSGPASAVNRRLKDKLAQAASGNSDLPAMASVVGFRAKLVVSADLENSQPSNWEWRDDLG